MSEYWKSTPRYFCEHCRVYVRDTRLERTNHEATGKHQGAHRRFLRGIHDKQDKSERDRDLARREIDRLNGVAAPAAAAARSASAGPGLGPGGPANEAPHRPSADVGPAGPVGPVGPVGPAATADRRRQLEQLAEMGVSIPDQFRGSMALAGDWTVTSERVIRRSVGGGGDQEAVPAAAAAPAARKRPQTEEEKEEDEVVNGLFKKPRVAGRWGRDTKLMAGGAGRDDLDELLGQIDSAVRPPAGVGRPELGRPDVRMGDHDVKHEEAKASTGENVKREETAVKEDDGEAGRVLVKNENRAEPELPTIKLEPKDEQEETKVATPPPARPDEPAPELGAKVKLEPKEEDGGSVTMAPATVRPDTADRDAAAAEAAAAAAAAAPLPTLFKKTRAKKIRQKG